MPSLETKQITVGDTTYDIVLLNVQEALKAEAEAINLLSGCYQGKADGEMMYSLAKRLLKAAEVNGKLVDIDEHFHRKVGQLNKVVFAALKENFPDFFGMVSGSVSSKIQAMLSGSASAQ